MAVELSTSINIKEPRWDQSTFTGRAKHFFTATDPRNILLSNEQLESTHKIITDYRELKHGIPTTDENDNRLGESTKAAQQAISQVVVSRILMVSPGMAIPPFLMNHFPKEGIFEEVPMDECTHSSGPGGILLGVRHSPLLCTLSTKEFHVGEPVGAGAAGEDPGESPGSGESVLQQGAIEERQPPSPS
ncbi:unnamed protein product [Lota lota]